MLNDNSMHDDSQASLFKTVWSPTGEAHNDKTRLAPDEGRNGEQRQEGAPCQWPTLSPITNAGTSATPSLPEQRKVVPATPLDAPDGTKMELDIPDDSGLEDNVVVALSEKTKLRKRLLWAEHHRTVINRCRQAHIVPTGLKLNRKVHPIKGDERFDVSDKIETIIKKAECL